MLKFFHTTVILHVLKAIAATISPVRNDLRVDVDHRLCWYLRLRRDIVDQS